MNFLTRHAEALQALGALLTAVFAVVALVGVKFQLDASERISREAQARDIYRSFLSLSLANPRLAAPGTCPAFTGEDATQYEFYLEYALYTAEQVIDMDPSWEGAFEQTFSEHLGWLCEVEISGYTPEVEALVTRLQATQCAAVAQTCAAE